MDFTGRLARFGTVLHEEVRAAERYLGSWLLQSVMVKEGCGCGFLDADSSPKLPEKSPAWPIP